MWLFIATLLISLMDTARGSSAPYILLNIDKEQRVAIAQTLPDPLQPKKFKILKKFPIAYGKSKGDKQVEGDNKTPEGLYFARPHIPKSRLLQSKYGPRAIPLNFPNPIDRIHRKSGHGIWLHGAGDDHRMENIFVTEGCVAFYNKDILAVSEFLKPYQSIVSISKNLSQFNSPEHIQQIAQRTLEWSQAWKERRVDDYIRYYHPDFVYKGKNISKYQKHKARIFNSYKKISLTMENLRVIAHDKYALSIMNQEFLGDNRFESVGRKVLYWINSHGLWQIIHESFSNRKFEPLSLDLKEQEKA